MACRRSASVTSCSSGRSGCASIARAREGGMTGAAARPMRVAAPQPIWMRFRPRLRGRELTLLALVALALYVGSVSLEATERFRAAQLNGSTFRLDVLAPAGASLRAICVGLLLVAHMVLVLSARRTDQVLLPTAGMLGGIGLLLMERLPQSLAGSLGGLAETQLVWLGIGIGITTVLAVTVRTDVWLRRYKYTW